jgi:hypothetical protein
MRQSPLGRLPRPVVLAVTAAVVAGAAVPAASAAASSPSAATPAHASGRASCLVLKDVPVTATDLDYHQLTPGAPAPEVGDWGTYVNVLYDASGKAFATMPGIGHVYASAVNGELENAYRDTLVFKDGSRVSAAGVAGLESILTGGTVTEALLGETGRYRGWYGEFEWVRTSGTEATGYLQLCPTGVVPPTS